MLLATGLTDGGRFGQLVADRQQAERLMSALNALSRRPISWTLSETEQTDVRLAVELHDRRQDDTKTT